MTLMTRNGPIFPRSNLVDQRTLHETTIENHSFPFPIQNLTAKIITDIKPKYRCTICMQTKACQIAV